MPELDQDSGFHDQVEKAVSEVEAQTSVEVVVVIASRSGMYRDADYLVGAVVAFFALALMRSLPQFMPAWSVLPEMIVSFWVGVLLSRTFWPVRRFFTSAARRREQVEEAAHAAFYEESIHCTRERTGLLIYCSLAEKQVEVIPDVGIESKLESEAWDTLRASMKQAPRRVRFLDGVRSLGRPLSRAFPASDENPDEIPNRPRVRGLGR